MAVYRTDLNVLRLATTFIEPLTELVSGEVRSRLMVMANGDTLPVLHQLARQKFKRWEKDQQPIWVDGDHHNETEENVALRERTVQRRVRRHTDLGFPAGTPEYMKAWRKANPDKARAAQKRYVQKRKELLASLKDLRAGALEEMRQRQSITFVPGEAGAKFAMDPGDPFSKLVEKLSSVIDDVLDDGGEEQPSGDPKPVSGEN
jgi:hypothetical protein